MLSGTVIDTVVLSLPSPSQGVWRLGPLPIRGYALAIILGVVVATIVAERRWKARGGKAGEIQDLVLWAVPFGIVGGRLYHVITDHGLYFGAGKHWYEAFFVWKGGLGIWGAIALGAVGLIIGAKRKGIRIAPLLDVVAPTALLGQGIGRWGNWFNQELFGRPTDLPWGLRIDAAHWPASLQLKPPANVVTRGDGTEYATFHPTFLYESIWDIAAFFLVVGLEKRFKLGAGRVAALYVSAYCFGRFWVEQLRIDTIELNNVLGMRWGDWMAILGFVGGIAYFVWATVTRRPTETDLYRDAHDPEAAAI